MRQSLLALLALTALLATGCSGAKEPATPAKSEAPKVAAAPATGGTPKAVVPETRFDFGDVPTSNNQKDTRIHEFVIRNEGQGDLVLGELQVKLLKGC